MQVSIARGVRRVRVNGTELKKLRQAAELLHEIGRVADHKGSAEAAALIQGVIMQYDRVPPGPEAKELPFEEAEASAKEPVAAAATPF